MATTQEQKITDYFPPSPTADSSEPQSPRPETYDVEDVTKLKDESPSFLSLPTPDTTPTKERSSHSKETNCSCGSPEQNLKSSDSTVGGNLNKSTSLHNLVEKSPSKGKGKRRGRGRGANKQGTKTSSKRRSHSAPNKKPETKGQNRMVTDYFPVRRSLRRCLADMKKDEQKELEEAILNERTDGLKVVDLEGKGRGVVATKNFFRGDFVVEYAGDLITPAEAQKREQKYTADSSVGCYMYYFCFRNKKYCVDATAESGKLGRLLNHSRHGNCCTKVVGINGTPYLILVAARDIKTGEELVYDYGDRSKASLESHPWLAK